MIPCGSRNCELCFDHWLNRQVACFLRSLKYSSDKLEVYKGNMRCCFITLTFDTFALSKFRLTSGKYDMKGLTQARSNGIRGIRDSSAKDAGFKVTKEGYYQGFGVRIKRNAWPFRYLSAWDLSSGRLHNHMLVGAANLPFVRFKDDWRFGSVNMEPVEMEDIKKFIKYIADYIQKAVLGNFCRDRNTSGFGRRVSSGIYEMDKEGSSFESRDDFGSTGFNRKGNDLAIQTVSENISKGVNEDGLLGISLGEGNIGECVKRFVGDIIGAGRSTDKC